MSKQKRTAVKRVGGSYQIELDGRFIRWETYEDDAQGLAANIERALRLGLKQPKKRKAAK